MQPGMTTTAYKQGLINAAICTVAMAAVIGLLLVPSYLIYGRIHLGAFMIAASALAALANIGFFIQWAYGKGTGGRLVLDLGRHPTWYVFAVNLLVFRPASAP